MLFIEKLWMELNSVESAAFLLHGLDLAGVVGGGDPKPIGHFLYLVAVIVPNGDFGGQAFEESFASVFHWMKTALAFRAFITLAGFKTLHQTNLCSVRDRNLLVATTQTEYGLT